MQAGRIARNGQRIRLQAFDLEVVASPEGVLQRLERGTYAAVLICVEVADNKGYALCSTIRKNSGLDRVRIVLKEPWPDFMASYGTSATGAPAASKRAERTSEQMGPSWP